MLATERTVEGACLYGRVYDVAIIGGGITGTAVARDAAGRGLSVFLCDEDDLGGASAASVTSVFGGIEHLAKLNFAAMREAVAEREILTRAAPHLARPLTIVIPHHERQWPLPALRLGLFALDHAAASTLQRARTVALDRLPEGPLQQHFTHGVAYSDCAADNGRVALHNAMDARARGAEVFPRLRCTIAERDGGEWHLSLESARGDRFVVSAAMLVNAGGGRAADVLNHVAHGSVQVRVRLSRHTWLAVRHPAFGDTAYALPSADGQIVYALPFEGDTLLLGPVTSPYDGDPAVARVERSDVLYLADITEQYFRVPLAAADIVRSFVQVSALPSEQSALAKGGGAIVVDDPPLVAPLISVFGGTFAVHRRLAEDVVDRMGRYRPIEPGWTREAVLPGGGYPAGGERDIARALSVAYPFISENHAARLVRAYGTRASAVLTGARCASDLGQRFGADLTEAEVRYLCDEEWAQTAEDVLWRRSRMGASVNAAGAAVLEGWFGAGKDAPVGGRLVDESRETAF
jgi:glycerol-3-phosphate dehydrogenase